MKKKILCTMMSMVMAASLFAGCGTETGTETSVSDNSKTEETGTEAAEHFPAVAAGIAGTEKKTAAVDCRDSKKTGRMRNGNSIKCNAPG